MKTFAILSFAAASLVATPAPAQDGRTVTFDGETYSGTRTITHDDGTTTRDTDVTRKSDGATAQSSFVRRRTETGVTRDRSTSHFDGSTSSTSYERWRTPRGWRAEAEHVGRGGHVVGYHARGFKTPRGRVVGQAFSVDGRPVAARRVHVRHGPYGTTRRVVRRR